MKKVDARSISSSAQEHLRQIAITAVLAGKKQREVAQVLGITLQTVCRWVKRTGCWVPWPSNQDGKADHEEVSSCLGRRLKLPRRSLIIIRNSSSCLFSSGPGRRWRSLLNVVLACSCRSGPWVAISNAGVLPHKNQPGGPGEQNPEQVRQWLEKEYPTIRRQAQKEKAQIYWGDEWGYGRPRRGTSYGLKGQRR